MTTLGRSLQEALALSILTDEEVLLVSNMPSARASVNRRLKALDCLASLIQQQDNRSMQPNVIPSFQVGIVLFAKHAGAFCSALPMSGRSRQL